MKLLTESLRTKKPTIFFIHKLHFTSKLKKIKTHLFFDAALFQFKFQFNLYTKPFHKPKTVKFI